jgi:hypothetical protein
MADDDYYGLLSETHSQFNMNREILLLRVQAEESSRRWICQIRNGLTLMTSLVTVLAFTSWSGSSAWKRAKCRPSTVYNIQSSIDSQKGQQN